MVFEPTKAPNARTRKWKNNISSSSEMPDWVFWMFIQYWKSSSLLFSWYKKNEKKALKVPTSR